MGLEWFLKHAKDYNRNPLSIISLFIVLIYAFASLVFIFSDSLDNYQIWLFLLFLIIFPVIVLFVFRDLVINHHSKLYAPKDYREDKSFLQPLQEKDKEKNVEKEIEDEKRQEKLPELKIDDEIKKLTNRRNQFVHNFYSTNEDVELKEYFLQIEKLVIDKLSIFYSHMEGGLGFEGQSRYIQFDAQAFLDNKTLLFEIKIFRKKMLPNTIKNIVNRFIEDLKTYLKLMKYNEKILAGIIVVTSDFESLGKEYKPYLHKEFGKHFGKTDLDISLLLLDLNDLEIS